jgi:serine phosphatase RsbU (regulator of sigma subunit)
MVLFIGVGMLVLWEMKLSLILVAVTIISNVVFYQLNSHLTIDEFITNGGLLVLTVLIFMVYLIRNRYRLTYKEIRSRLELEKSKTLIELQKEEVEEKNEEIKSSIRYAKRIQDSLLPPDAIMDELFHQNYFVYYKPKDIVSGDFYWAAPVKTTSETPYHLSLAAVVDCTGHGVPGAFMSIVGSNFLKQSLTEKAVNNVAEALDFLNQKVISTLNQSSNIESKVRDGMDVALVALDYAKNKLYYSGANNAIYVLRKQTEETEIITLKATKQAIGSVSDTIQTYRLEVFDLQKGDTIYLFSDGYADQFGDIENKKLNYKRFKVILTEAFDMPIHHQKAHLQSRFEAWLGNAEQTDDVCVMGIKI